MKTFGKKASEDCKERLSSCKSRFSGDRCSTRFRAVSCHRCRSRTTNKCLRRCVAQTFFHLRLQNRALIGYRLQIQQRLILEHGDQLINRMDSENNAVYRANDIYKKDAEMKKQLFTALVKPVPAKQISDSLATAPKV